MFRAVPPLSSESDRTRPEFRLLGRCPSTPELLVELFFHRTAILRTGSLIFTVLLTIFTLDQRQGTVRHVIGTLFGLALTFALFLLGHATDFFTRQRFDYSVNQFFVNSNFFAGHRFHGLVINVNRRLFRVAGVVVAT